MALFNNIGRVVTSLSDIVVNTAEAIVPVTKAVGELGTASELYAKDVRLDAESDIKINSIKREARYNTQLKEAQDALVAMGIEPK